jgi:hypothetical protein
MRIPALVTVAAALLLGLLPVQAQDASRGAKRTSSGFSISTGEACSGLSPQECCAQKLELAGFKAQGDYLPHLIKTTVELACRDEHRVVTSQVCKSIATSRGFAPKEVSAICAPAQRECQKDGTCRTCSAELSKLSYQGSYHACYALTYRPERSRSSVVVLRNGGAADSDTRFEITRRRTAIR